MDEKRGRGQSAQPAHFKIEKGNQFQKKNINYDVRCMDIYYPTRVASEVPGAIWDTSLSGEDHYNDRSLLIWAYLQWKPYYSAFLKGIKNWNAYKEAHPTTYYNSDVSVTDRR